MRAVYKKMLASFPTLLVGVYLVASVFIPAGSKFDMGRKIWVTLLFAFIVLSIFGFKLAERLSIGKMTLGILDKAKYLFLGSYVLWVWVSFFTSQTKNFGFTEVLMTSSVALLFVAGGSVFKRRWLYALALMLLLMCSLGGYILYFSSPHTRAFGLFYDPAVKNDAWPNAFALFFLLLWPLFFHYVWRAEYCKVVKVFIGGLILASFLLTFSRAGFLVFMAQAALLSVYGVVVFLIDRKRKNSVFPWRNVFSVAAMVLVSLGFIFLAQSGREFLGMAKLNFEEKAKFAHGEQLTSVDERLDFWKGAFVLIKREPIFGYGPMSFGYVYRSIQANWLAASDHPHNVFLKIAAESGLPAALFFLSFLLCLFIQWLVAFKNANAEKRFILLLLFLAAAGALLHNQVDYNFNFATNLIVFWLLLATINDEVTTSPRKVAGRAWVQILFMPIFVLVLVFTLTQTYEVGGLILAYRQKDPTLKAAGLQAYENVLMPRYFLLDQAVEAEKQGNVGLAEDYYVRYTQQNMWDAQGFIRLGSFYETHKDLLKAQDNFAHALTLDAKNEWIYYLKYLDVLSKLNKRKELLEEGGKVIVELEEYVPRVEMNLHFTAQQPNSLMALNVIKLLRRWDTKNSKVLADYAERISTAREKFSKR